MDAEKTAIAARLYISLRREAKRSIDVEWLLKNADYAHEVIALAKQHSPELVELANHLEALLPAPPTQGHATDTTIPTAPPPANRDISDRYIGRLR